ncbi:MAG: precorrin-6y C5,15-methyltransferase (decarboxylating) subunit CbiE [Beijerinckiaceae bacterium]
MTDPSRPWLALIGIGEDGRAGLTPCAQQLLDEAAFIVGGARHLQLAQPLHAEIMTWPVPLQDAFPAILAHRPKKVCVLASGDPFFYGVGSLLSAVVAPAEMICVPGPSAFSLAAARLGWALQSCRLVSLHGRDLSRIIPDLQPRAKILALSWDGSTPKKLADLLCERGLGASFIFVLQAMGGPREKITRQVAAEFRQDDIDPLNLVAVEIVADEKSRVLPLGSGLAESWFETDGQITKRHVRAVTLSALAPRRGDLLWDIGAGSGSIAIEWLLLDPQNRAIAIEINEERAARIKRNAVSLGVPHLEVVIGRAPEALSGLPKPQAIFVGGGAMDEGVLDIAYAALEPGGRLVVNAVTLETQAELVHRFKTQGGELISIAIGHAEPLRGFHAFRPALPITQWVVRKPW